jgi:hypothetical protein
MTNFQIVNNAGMVIESWKLEDRSPKNLTEITEKNKRKGEWERGRLLRFVRNDLQVIKM